MPVLIAIGTMMLFFLLAGLSDKHQDRRNEPRRVDPMSVPYETPTEKPR